MPASGDTRPRKIASGDDISREEDGMSVSEQNILTKFGGRRFLMTLGGCFVFTLLLVNGHISEATYATLVTLFTAGFVGSNLTQKIMQK